MNHVNESSIPRESLEAGQPRPRRGWSRIVAKLLLVPFLLFFSLVVGLIIGYSVLGKLPASEVFDLGTYKHMYDLIFAGT
ncbi:MAG: DNA-directed RNA polymerase subunit beta [Clostridia bacterium]